MPRGGWRPGGGRPTKAVQAAKAAALAAAIEAGPKTSPRKFAQGIIDSPSSTTAEKLKACELLAKLPPEALPSTENPPAEFVIWSLPRGAQMGPNGTVIWPDGTTEPAQALEPFTPTPPISATPRRAEPEACGGRGGGRAVRAG